MNCKADARLGGRGLRTSRELRWIQNAKKTALRQRKWQEQRLQREEEEKSKAKEMLDLRRKERARLAAYIYPDMHSSTRSSPSLKQRGNQGQNILCKTCWTGMSIRQQDLGLRFRDILKCSDQIITREAEKHAAQGSVATDVSSVDRMPLSVSLQQLPLQPLSLGHQDQKQAKLEKIRMPDCRKPVSIEFQTAKPKNNSKMERLAGNSLVTRYKLPPLQVLHALTEHRVPKPAFIYSQSSESSDIVQEPCSGVQCKMHFNSPDDVPLDSSGSSVSIVIRERPEKSSHLISSLPYCTVDSSSSTSDRRISCLESSNCQTVFAEDMNTFLEEALQLKLANEAATSRLIAEVTAIESRLEDCIIKPVISKECTLLPSCGELSVRNLADQGVPMDQQPDTNEKFSRGDFVEVSPTFLQERSNFSSCINNCCVGNNDLVQLTSSEIEVEESPYSTIMIGSPCYMPSSLNIEGETENFVNKLPFFEGSDQAALSYQDSTRATNLKFSPNSESLEKDRFELMYSKRCPHVSEDLESLEQDANPLAISHEKISLQQPCFENSRNRKTRQPNPFVEISVEEKHICASLERLDWKLAAASAKCQHPDRTLNVAGSSKSAPTTTIHSQGNESQGKMSFRSTTTLTSKQQIQRRRQLLGLTNACQVKRPCMYTKSSFLKRNFQVYDPLQRRSPFGKIVFHKDAEFLLMS